MSIEYRVGDVFDRLAEIPDGSIDLIVTSPPFLALRSYLPSDHPDKHKEIGSEPTPAEFIDTLLALTAEWGRVLAPHGSLCVELGDTYSGIGTGDKGGANSYRAHINGHREVGGKTKRRAMTDAWPLAKSLTGIPTLYPWSLAYGRNLLTGQPSPAGQWRIRNVIVWARPNPPVGALGDKFRPATSYITVACKGPKRYFDLDAVRTPGSPNTHARTAAGVDRRESTGKTADDERRGGNWSTLDTLHDTAGAPPLDWHADNHPEDGDWLWKLSTQPYAGSHYATYPLALPTRLIKAMCPQRVCNVCGKPSERITTPAADYAEHLGKSWADRDDGRSKAATTERNSHSGQPVGAHITAASRDTIGWTDCGHDDYRVGRVLDPFAGSGTTLEAAQAFGRHGIGIDLDSRNADLAQSRVGMFLEVTA
jgi:site-specific DNA-methyltransferase (adenine-specific)